MRQVKFATNKWEITSKDVGSVMLLAEGVERKIVQKDVGMIYVVNEKKGDYLEEPPLKEEFDEEDDNYDDY